jgi:hypothetical protein
MIERPPILGDIRYCNPERDTGKDPKLVTDFEVWDGKRWVHATEAANNVFNVQSHS